MARPNNPEAIARHVRGLREAKRAFQALPEITRNALNEATEVTVREIARQAQAKILASPSVQTRSLHDAIAWTMNRKSGRGRVGVSNLTTTIRVGGKNVRVKGRLIAGRGGSASTAAGAKLIRPSRYAHLVEFGARHMPAEPFMLPATEREKSAYLRRCQMAGKQIEKQTAAIGARVL